MRPLLVILLVVFLELEIYARHTSREYVSESKYRERTTNSRSRDDDSPEEVVRPKSSRLGEKSTKSRYRNDSPEEYVPKSKYRSSGSKYSSKSSSSSSRLRDGSLEEYTSKSRKKDDRKSDRKSKEDDLPKDPEKDLKEDAPVNTEQLNFQFWNFKNLANYQNNGQAAPNPVSKN